MTFEYMRIRDIDHSYPVCYLCLSTYEKNDFLQNNYNGDCDQSILYTSMKPIIYTVEAIFCTSNMHL